MQPCCSMLPHLMVLAMSILHTIAWQVYCMFESVVVSYNSSKTTVLMENSGLKEGSKRSPKKLRAVFFSRFASLCAGIIHKVSHKRLNQVKMFHFELFQ